MFWYWRNIFFLSKCKNHKIPIIRQKTAKYIFDYIEKQNYHSLLEVGTGYGFSSYLFSFAKPIREIVTIEKKYDSFLMAKKFLRKRKQIQIINNDAFLFNTTKKFDVIFLDGPKSRLKEMQNIYLKFLNKNGVLFIDNLKLNVIRSKENKTKRQKKLIEKMDDFISFLDNNQFINFEYIDIDDGLAKITMKKE